MTMLSFSQGKDYQGNGYAAYITRVAGFPSQPNWSTIGGSAFHRIVEAMERNRHGENVYIPTYMEALEAVIEDELKRGRTAEFWDESTFKASKSGKGVPRDGIGADRKWIEQHLPVWLDNYVRWRRVTPWDIALLPDENGEARPAVEVNWQFEVADDVTLRGSLDALYVNRADQTYRIVDYKAGAWEPDSPMQLAVYRQALKDQYDVDADYGTFYMARSGMTTEMYDLRKYTPRVLEWWYTQLARRKEYGDFLHDAHQCQMFKSTLRFCWFCDGEDAHLVETPWEREDRLAREAVDGA